jgi:hypothetical protein
MPDAPPPPTGMAQARARGGTMQQAVGQKIAILTKTEI